MSSSSTFEHTLPPQSSQDLLTVASFKNNRAWEHSNTCGNHLLQLSTPLPRSVSVSTRTSPDRHGHWLNHFPLKLRKRREGSQPSPAKGGAVAPPPLRTNPRDHPSSSAKGGGVHFASGFKLWLRSSWPPWGRREILPLQSRPRLAVVHLSPAALDFSIAGRASFNSFFFFCSRNLIVERLQSLFSSSSIVEHLLDRKDLEAEWSHEFGVKVASKLTLRPSLELEQPWWWQASKPDPTLKLAAAMANSSGRCSRMSRRQWAVTNVRHRSLVERSWGWSW